MQPVAIPQTGNPRFPLPADYDDLSSEGQRRARVNATRLWLLPSSIMDPGDSLCHSHWFFDHYYLHPDIENDFDPMFYDLPPVESAPFHWSILRHWAHYNYNICIAPRGSAKSTLNKRDILMRLLSHPVYSMVYATSSHDNSQAMGQGVRDQIWTNERIIQDFAPEYGSDTLRPPRGTAPSGVDYFQLTNRSWIKCISAQSRQRGLRPRRYRLDDPEFDEKGSTDTEMLRDYMDRLLTKVILPMTMRPDTGVDWLATFVSKRHYAWSAMSTIETPDGPRAEDPRFNMWGRMKFPLVWTDKEGKERSAWPHMWPINDDEKAALKLNPKTITIPQMRATLGESNFNSEMMAKPGSANDDFFKVDTTPHGAHAWWLRDPDENTLKHPTKSNSMICWKYEDTTVEVPLKDFLKQTRLFMTMDTAYTVTPTSDRRVACLLGVHSKLADLKGPNELFVLDLWSAVCTDSKLEKEAFQMSERWGCPTIFVETVKDSYKLYERMRATAAQKLAELLQDDQEARVPSVQKFIPKGDKTSRIATLDIRFEHNLIKIPMWQRFQKPPIDRLVNQLLGFSPEVENGGLAKDDETDVVAMSTPIIQGRMLRARSAEEAPELDPLQEIKEGRLFDSLTGLPHAYSIDWTRVSSAEVMEVYHSRLKQPTQRGTPV